MKFDILVAHPGKHHALHLVSGCIKSGLAVRYITPFYRCGLGAVVALIPGKIGSKARGYFHPNIPLNIVVSPLKCQFRKLYSLFKSNLSNDSAFDLFVAHAIENGKYQAKILITLQDYMPATVRAAKKHGWKIWSDQILNQSDEMAIRIAQHEQSLGFLNTSQHNEKNNDEMIAAADVVTVPSSYTLDGIKNRVPVDAQLVTIPYGASAKKFAGERQIDDHQIVILARAQSVRKGGHLLLQALQQSAVELLAVCTPKKIKVVILGNLEPALCILLNQLVLPKDLSLVSGNIPHSQVEHLYRKASIFVMPSLSEGMSLACLEAMHAGLPLIITKYCGIDSFESGQMGYEISDTKESLSIALVEAFKHKQSWEMWGENSKRLAYNLSWTEYERSISSVVKKLLC